MDKVKSILLIIFSIIVIVLVVYNIYSGATVQKVGIPGIFEINFGSSPPTSAPPPVPRPDIKFLDMNITSPDTSKPFGDRFRGTFVIFNEGSTTAEGCILWLGDGGSVEFGIRPNQQRQVEALTSSLYNEGGTYELRIIVDCDNYTSQPITKRFSFP